MKSFSEGADLASQKPFPSKKKLREEVKSEKQRLKSKWLEGADGGVARQGQEGPGKASASATSPPMHTQRMPPSRANNEVQDSRGGSDLGEADPEVEGQTAGDEEASDSVGDWVPLATHLGLPTSEGLQPLLEHFSATLTGFLVGGEPLGCWVRTGMDT